MGEPISAKLRSIENFVPSTGKDGASGGNDSATPVTRPKARTELGRRLREIRDRYIGAGGELLTVEEVDREIADRRGERYPVEGA